MKKTYAEGKCKSKELAYVGKCIKHNFLYAIHT